MMQPNPDNDFKNGQVNAVPSSPRTAPIALSTTGLITASLRSGRKFPGPNWEVSGQARGTRPSSGSDHYSLFGCGPTASQNASCSPDWPGPATGASFRESS